MQCLPDSSLPTELEKLGYHLEPDGEGERILPTAITERFVQRGDGQLVPLTEGSTRPIAETRTHAGICKVKRYAFDLP
jgi:hypothetical protein